MGVLDRPLTLEFIFDNRRDMTIEINMFDEISFLLAGNFQRVPA